MAIDDLRETALNEWGAELANDASTFIGDALAGGDEPREVFAVLAMVLADWARMEFGDEYLGPLARMIEARAQFPLPGNVVKQ